MRFTQRHVKTIPAVLTSALFLLASGCSSPPKALPASQHATTTTAQPVDPADSELELVLYDHYQQWKGTPYRLGGLNRHGIDCSGFVYRAFRDRLGRSLPRTTSQLARSGYRIDRRELQAGDLVFFRPGGSKQHVGIYLDNGLFMHASTSIGVTLSRLDNRYWRQYYWQSRRIPL